MITNLFSVFDPSSAMFSLAWLVLLMLPIFVPLAIWRSNPVAMNIENNITGLFYNEVSFTLVNEENGVSNMAISIFVSILLINFLALYPQVFSVTSHLAITLPLSLTWWSGIILFGWTNNTNHMLAHLVPQGTPNALIAFIVLIETVSNLIRPITLCVRLTANLIAGHLLITLLGNSLIATSFVVSFAGLAAPLVLTVLESAVACIQAYVFITLITLYVTEVNYDNNI